MLFRSQNSILYPQSPEDYGSVLSSSSGNIDYGLLQEAYDEILNYGQVIYGYNETVYPYGTTQISGSSGERFKPATAIGSGSISASGIKQEAITTFYGINSVGINTSIESLIDYGNVVATYFDYGSVLDSFPANQYTNYGSVLDSLPANQYTDYGRYLLADEVEDYGLIISSIDEVDSYGFFYDTIFSFGIFNISGSAGERFKPATVIGSGSIVESGSKQERIKDVYGINSILLGTSPENYGTVNSSVNESESYGLINAPIDQAENYDYIFYPAGSIIYPYGTIQVSGDSFNELRTKFTQIGSEIGRAHV